MVGGMRMINCGALPFALAAIFAACAPALHTSAREAVVVERLFFGRNVNGVAVVSDAAWELFLREVVTPRFPDGFTTWPAQGQWHRAGEQGEQEASFVLELVHPASEGADTKVLAIVAAYKLRFHQDSVLRVVVSGRAAF